MNWKLNKLIKHLYPIQLIFFRQYLNIILKNERLRSFTRGLRWMQEFHMSKIVGENEWRAPHSVCSCPWRLHASGILVWVLLQPHSHTNTYSCMFSSMLWMLNCPPNISVVTLENIGEGCQRWWSRILDSTSYPLKLFYWAFHQWPIFSWGTRYLAGIIPLKIIAYHVFTLQVWGVLAFQVSISTPCPKYQWFILTLKLFFQLFVVKGRTRNLNCSGLTQNLINKIYT